MSTTLDYSMRSAMSELYKEDRWGVLTLLILHANGLNRCWPSMKQIARELDICLANTTRAKQWLIEHSAVSLVPYNKRVGDELALPRRQHVYQLTGAVLIDGKSVPYLYQQPVTSKSEVLQNEISPDRISTPDSTKYYPEENTSESNNTSEHTMLGNIKIYESNSKPNLPSQYGDIFVLVRQYCFNDARSKSVDKRSGELAKILVKENPALTVEQFGEFYRQWINKGLNFPSKITTLPVEVAAWLSKPSKPSGSTAPAISSLSAPTDPDQIERERKIQEFRRKLQEKSK